MGLAAAEVRLQFDHWVAAAAGKSLGGTDQESAQTLGQIGAAEELTRVAVLGRRAARMNLGEIGRELGLLKLASGNIRMRLYHFAPGQ